jgi:hypothetical protein
VEGGRERILSTSCAADAENLRQGDALAARAESHPSQPISRPHASWMSRSATNQVSWAIDRAVGYSTRTEVTGFKPTCRARHRAARHPVRSPRPVWQIPECPLQPGLEYEVERRLAGVPHSGETGCLKDLAQPSFTRLGAKRQAHVL